MVAAHSCQSAVASMEGEGSKVMGIPGCSQPHPHVWKTDEEVACKRWFGRRRHATKGLVQVLVDDQWILLALVSNAVS